MEGMPENTTAPYVLPDDPLSRMYREQVDVTLLRANLKRTVEERLENLMALQRFAEELREAGRRARARGSSA
jgi:hypothetical protein